MCCDSAASKTSFCKSSNSDLCVITLIQSGAAYMLAIPQLRTRACSFVRSNPGRVTKEPLIKRERTHTHTRLHAMETVRSSVLCRLLPPPISLVLCSLVLVLLFAARKSTHLNSLTPQIHSHSWWIKWFNNKDSFIYLFLQWQFNLSTSLLFEFKLLNLLLSVANW